MGDKFFRTGNLVPSALLGGDIIGVRLLVARGRDVSTVSGAMVAYKTLEAAGFFFFSLTGLLIMLERRGNIGLKHWEVIGLAAISAVLILFLVAQRWGMLRVADKIVSPFARKCGGVPGSADMTGIYDTVWAIYANRHRLALSIFLHTLSEIPLARKICKVMRCILGNGKNLLVSVISKRWAAHSVLIAGRTPPIQ